MINKTDKALSSSDSETIQLQNENPKTKVKKQHLPDNKSENGINDLLSQLPPRLAIGIKARLPRIKPNPAKPEPKCFYRKNNVTVNG